jgi:hypothetical protein
MRHFSANVLRATVKNHAPSHRAAGPHSAIAGVFGVSLHGQQGSIANRPPV